MKKMWKLGAVALMLCVLLIPCMAQAAYSMPVQNGDLSVNPDLDENVKNILLIGTDTREKALESGRADTMMICSVNTETGAIRVISLARDTWVTMGENGHWNKLNAAYSFGGPDLLMQTINRTYNLNLRHYVAVNFYGICDIVDAMGGVTVQLDKNEAWAINSTVEESYAHYSDERIQPIAADATQAHLCGAQALAYARIRKLDNDFGRQNRQRKLLMAMGRQFSEASIPQMISLATTCFSYVSTNMPLTEMIGIGTKVMSNGIGDVRMFAYPEEGEFRYDSADGVSKLIIDTQKGTERIHGILYSVSQ